MTDKSGATEYLIVGGPRDGERITVANGLRRVVFPAPDPAGGFGQFIYELRTVQTGSRTFDVFAPEDWGTAKIMATLIAGYKPQRAHHRGRRSV